MNKKVNHVFFVYLNVRLGAIIAAFYYFVITVGISLSLHFCKGELSCFSLVPRNDDWCCHSAEHEDTDSSESKVCPENCCTTEFLSLSLDTDFTTKSIEIHEVSAITGRLDHNTIHSEPVSSQLPEANTTRGSPPEENLYLIYSKFVFYG